MQINTVGPGCLAGQLPNLNRCGTVTHDEGDRNCYNAIKRIACYEISLDKLMSCLYIHIPFCLQKCAYCSFVSFAGREELFDRYVAALCREAEQTAARAPHTPLSTLFFGGGTPSLLPAASISRIIDCCHDLLGFTSGIEISLEANPGTIDYVKLAELRRAGVNRLSIGVQSFDDHELHRLGRAHSGEQALTTVRHARKAGFDNLSLDLMSGLPGQTADAWRRNLEQALALKPEHLSCYQLTIEEDTPFGRLQNQGLLELPHEDAIVAMDEITHALAPAAGLERYEISNFARPGQECRHNLNYWHNRPYLALGAGAVSYDTKRRQRRLSDPQRYCELMESGDSVVIDEENLGTEASFRETIIMGLRLIQGVSISELQHRFHLNPGSYYGETLDHLISRNLLIIEQDRLRLTPSGLTFANRVMAELV